MDNFDRELEEVVLDVDLSVDQIQQNREDGDKFKKKAEAMFPKVMQAIKGLRETADKLDQVLYDSNTWRACGTSVGILGGLITIAGGIATVTTAGIASPLLFTGMAVGLAGAGTNVTGNIKETIGNSKELKKAEIDLKEALDSINEVMEIIQEWLEKKDISSLIYISKLAEAQKWSKPIMKLLGTTLYAAREMYLKAGQAGGPAAGKAGAKAFGMAGAGAAGMAGAGAAGMAGAQAAGEAGTKGAKQAGARAAGKAGAQVADDVAQVGTKVGSKLAGGLIIGVSAVFLAWDVLELGFTIRDLVDKKGSDAGNELRRKADVLQNILIQKLGQQDK